MRKVFYVLLIMLFCAGAFAKDSDYISIYNSLEKPDFQLVHGLDPYQNDDYYKYAWSPYPLFRSISTLYFKDLVIKPGYYLLTPREIKGRDYVFFKQAGRVQFIIPVAKKGTIDPIFYVNRVPKPKETKWQKFKGKCSRMFHRTLKNTKKRPAPNSYITQDWVEGADLILITLYFGLNKYVMVFRTSEY